METKSWMFGDKSTWGPGPWQEEPDTVAWCDLLTRLPCLVLRADMGHLCGYVGVPPGHLLWGWDPLGETDDPLNLDVHHGLNWAQACGNPALCAWVHPEDAAAHRWFLGFDCGHAFDLSPGHEARMAEVERALPAMARFSREVEATYAAYPRLRSVYRTLAYVQEQCARLAAQLASLQVIDAEAPCEEEAEHGAHGNDPL